MLSRESISSGAYLESFDTLPKELLWSAQRIENSLAQTMLSRPDSGDIWIFGYGSLIWNPLLEFDQQEIATLDGWHRKFCIRIIAGRASQETPGRMLALVAGGSTQGVAYRLSAADLHEELRLVWIREMVAGSYCPTWSPVTFPDGRTVNAIVFVADPHQQQFQTDSSVSSIAPIISAASGLYGTNTEYVYKLASALSEKGLNDAYISTLAAQLKQLAHVTP